MSRKLDGKFHGIIVKNKDGSIVPQDQWIVFLAKDMALLAGLRAYMDECHRIGASVEQMRAISALIRRVKDWQAVNAHLMKIPDVEEGEIIV